MLRQPPASRCRLSPRSRPGSYPSCSHMLARCAGCAATPHCAPSPDAGCGRRPIRISTPWPTHTRPPQALSAGRLTLTIVVGWALLLFVVTVNNKNIVHLSTLGCSRRASVALFVKFCEIATKNDRFRKMRFRTGGPNSERCEIHYEIGHFGVAVKVR